MKIIVFIFLLSTSVFSQKITSIDLKKKKIAFTNKNLENIEVFDQLITYRNGKKKAYIVVEKIKKRVIVGKIYSGVPKFNDKIKKGKFYILDRAKSKKSLKNSEFNVGLAIETISTVKNEQSQEELIEFSPNFKLNLGIDIPVQIKRKEFMITLNLNSNFFQAKALPINAPNQEQWSYYSMNLTFDLAYLFKNGFYVRGGTGASYLNYKGKINPHTGNQDENGRARPYIGSYNEKLLGYSFGPGLGYRLRAKKNTIKFDLGYYVNKTLNAKSNNPLGQEIDKHSLNKVRFTISYSL